MSVITKDLGVATAYGYAKSKGYTGTEEEFAELMASYADVAQQAEAAAQDAEDAKTAAQAAQSAAETASGTASTKASEAAQSAQSAAGSASAAQTSATAASGSASTAQTAAQTATTKASEASSSASAASTAKTGAETARTGAQTAQTAAETAQANAEAAASSVSASAAQIEQNTEEIGAIKNDFMQFPNGNYPQMGAGYANQLVSGLKKADSTPYNFRAVPYDATLEEVKKIVGGTLAWNQRMDISNMADTTRDGITWKNNRDGTWTANGTATANSTIVILTLEHPSDAVKEGHKYFIGTGYDDATGASFRTEVISRDAENSNAIYIDLFRSTVVNAKKTGVNLFCELRVFSGVTANNFTFVPTLIDLTLVLGTSIADYVYSLETATAGAGVAWLKKHFPAQFNSGYQAYDAGSLQSVSGLTEHKMVGFNQWDEEWEPGDLNTNNGTNYPDSTRIRSKNYIPVLPSTTYYFKCPNGAVSCYYDIDKNYIKGNNTLTANSEFVVPANAYYLRFGVSSTYGNAYNHDICINLSDPTKNGTYEPYEAHSYALDSDVVLRGIPRLDSNNQLYYDGDEYLPDGTVTRNIKVYTPAELNILYAPNNSGYANIAYARITKPNDAKANNSASYFPLLVEGYPLSYATTNWDSTEKVGYAFYGADTATWWVGFAHGTTLEQMKTALVGKTILYAATPTTETADPYTTPQIIAPDGTEEYIYADGAFELPVGHSSDYPVDVSGQLDDILDTPSANGTYTLKATVADGAVTYSWVADA